MPEGIGIPNGLVPNELGLQEVMDEISDEAAGIYMQENRQPVIEGSTGDDEDYDRLHETLDTDEKFQDLDNDTREKAHRLLDEMEKLDNATSDE